MLNFLDISMRISREKQPYFSFRATLSATSPPWLYDPFEMIITDILPNLAFLSRDKHRFLKQKSVECAEIIEKLGIVNVYNSHAITAAFFKSSHGPHIVAPLSPPKRTV
jgi:hypothetical protein